MEPPNPNPPPPATAAAATFSAAAAPSASQPPPQPPQQASAASTSPPASAPLAPNPNPNPRPAIPALPPPAALPRPWQQPSASCTTSSPASSASGPAPPRGGIAIGVPTHRPSPTPASGPASFSPSYGHFGGLARSGIGLPEPSSSPSQVRPSMAGVPSMGMLGSLGSGAQMRPGGIPVHHQQRPVQSSLRPVSSPGSQLPSSQNYQGHGLLRMPSAGSPSSPSPSTPQNVQSVNQPWLASGSQGKPPLPSSSFRQPVNPPSLQLRPHTQPQPQHQPQLQPQPQHQPQVQPQPQVQQQHAHSLGMTSQQHMPSLQQQQQQPSPPQQTIEHHGKQVPPSRIPQALSHQQQITRAQVSANQKPSTPASVQPNAAQSGAHNRLAISTIETDETSNRILGKRSIHELVNQVDPTEKLDSEVEEILMDIADDFVESVTTFGCSLAKHRKSTMLEAKDILLHLERNWNITLPGFAGDEIKTYRKPHVNDVHKERLAVIRKSMLAVETANTRNPAGQAAGSAKGSVVKTHASVIGSPNFKI